jgi:hypothetical protein
MTEEYEDNDEHCECGDHDCNEDDFITKAMFGYRDNISLPDSKLYDFIVVMTYQRDDEHISFWDDRFLNLDEHEEVASRYQIKAVGPREAIDAAMRIDAYRKACLMTGWISGIGDDKSYQEQHTILHNMGNSGMFNRMFFSEPTSIQVVMKENEDSMINRSMNEVINHSEHTASMAEEWLKEQTEENDGDTE